MQIKKERIASNLHREISNIIVNEIKDDELKSVTITHVKLNSDLSYAKIYFTTLLDNKRDIILKGLNKVKGFIKSELCKRKFKIRKIPELEFIYDVSIEYGNKIENILKELSE